MNPRYLEYIQSESIGMMGVYLVVKEDMVSCYFHHCSEFFSKLTSQPKDCVHF